MGDKIKMTCRYCKRFKMADRTPSDPPEAIVRETECPKCNDLGWAAVKWFDKDGARVDHQ